MGKKNKVTTIDKTDIKSIPLLQNVQERKKTTTDRALENFDDFYGSVFGLRWNKMRAALLSEHKYIAMVNNFGDTEKTCSSLEMDGAINLKSLIQLAKERIECGNSPEVKLSNDSSKFRVEDRLEQITETLREKEKQDLYPKTEVEMSLPERLQYNERDDLAANELASDVDSANDFVNPKKSLTQAMAEDTELDHSRFVDIEGGNIGALHEYIPASRIKGMEDWVPESDHYKYYQTTADFPLEVVEETEFTFPENLCLYTYEMGNCADFKPPRRCLTGVLSHFLMDGASILPPLFLDVRHGERVLDACAAPGGKSLLILQTLHPEMLICNDIQESRINRIRKVMQEYLFDFKERWDGNRVILHQSDARNIAEYESYDKVLVDVPCTTDRHSLMENDNNIFKPTRIKERLRIPELQSGILTNCLRLLKPGGSLVYSTCSLSPVQNDGVVHMALQKAFNEHNITVTIKDLSKLIQLFSDIYKFENPKGLKYGQMVIPYLPANFGPMYFSKLTRNA